MDKHIKPRALEKILKKAIKTFPAVFVTGPRQSGKTTLLKKLFAKTHKFVSLENPEMRLRAKEDPVAFLEQYQNPVIFDEIQYVPELLSYIKTKIDEKRKPGQWLFTGSQNFQIMQNISQSLAGRVAVLSLLPFSYRERIGKGDEEKNIKKWLDGFDQKKEEKFKTPQKQKTQHINEILLRGNYPEIATNKQVDRQLWCASYIATYLERDVRNIANIGDLNQFEKFLKLCAIRTGQILNVSEIAKETGMSSPTIKRWLSILEASYIVYLLQPYYKNIGKRLVKSPKLYFLDTALVTYLLGIHEKDTLLGSQNFGNIFETFIVTDILKKFLHSGEMPSMYYMKTRDGLEIDVVIERGEKLYLFEIKSVSTIMPRHADSLIKIAQKSKAFIISNSPESFILKKNIKNLAWWDAL